MFDRLLGPKTDHADPKVRAKAFAHDSLDQSIINSALETERDADVLCVILSRADDLAGVLEHATKGEGSIANEARTRLVTLAQTGNSASSGDWAAVFESARRGRWAQLAALNELLGPDSGREAYVQGALQTLPDEHELSERVLFTLATQSGGSTVRQLASRRLQSRELLESCCHELREKDKTVYKELRQRIDALKLDDDRRILARKLEADCDALASVSVLAQPEAVAVTQSRKQTLEKKIGDLYAAAPSIGKAAHERFARMSDAVDQILKTAREHVEKRKQLKARLAGLAEALSDGSHDQSLDPVAMLDEIRSEWQQIPDHTDMEQAAFERDVASAGDLAQQLTRDRGVAAGLSARIDRWEAQAEKEPPMKLLQRIRREWDSAEKPRDEEQLSALKQRIETLEQRLNKRESELAEKRANNSRQLLAVLDEFVATMEQGEFKKALSLNDKLRARSANRELEPDARRRIEEELRKAQPKLEEFRKWRHFGTQQARDTLLGQANALVSDPPASPKALAEQVKGLREAWRKLDQDDGRAAEAQWQTFNNACKEAYKPAKKHFDQLSKERKANLARKKALIESLESLLNDTDWSAPDWAAVTGRHKELMTEWRKTGTVDYKFKKQLDASLDRVNKAIDEQLNDEREREIVRRRRLIDRLRTEQQTESGGRLAASAKRAQREWRPSVQADRKTEKALWDEFRVVCDEIFGALKEQRKEAKVAWQADASERESVCEQIDQLLADAPEAGAARDRKAANQASGQLQEFARRWRQRHQIPGAVMSKLESRYKAARQGAEKRIRAVLQQEEQRAAERLDELQSVCQSAEEALLSGRFDPTDYASHASEFETLRGVPGKALIKRYARVMQGLNGDGAVADTLRDELEQNLKTRQTLCLLGELVADIDSPAHAQEERMALRMKRLTEAMQGELPAARDELATIVEQWYSAGGVAAGEWASVSERFAKVRAALGGANGS